MEGCVVNDSQRAETAAAGTADDAAPLRQQQPRCRRRAKHPMTPAEACVRLTWEKNNSSAFFQFVDIQVFGGQEIIGNAWRKRLDREYRLLQELKEATSLLRNEAACIIQSCFRGFLLRKALGEELQTTVIRWKNPPPGKRHEAEISMPDPPKWTKKFPMHFCPIRQAYVCPVPVVKGRLLVRFLVDDKAFPLHPGAIKDADTGDSCGLLILPGTSLGDRIASKYPWKAARQWLQQQQRQNEQQLEQQELPATKEQQEELRGARAEQSTPQERQQQQETSAPGQTAQHFLERGTLEAPMRPPRRFGVGLLGTHETSSSGGSNRNERIVYSWGAPCRPPWSPLSSSSEERELSPLQRRPSWASGARLNQGRPARVPPRWRQHEQQYRQQQDQEQNGQTQQRQQQPQQQHSQQHGCSQHQCEKEPLCAPNSNKSRNWSASESVGFSCSPTCSSREAATREATPKTTAATAATGSAAVSICCGDGSRGIYSPQLPTAPSYWSLCRCSSDSQKGGPSPTGGFPPTPVSNSSSVCQQQRWGQPLQGCSLSPLLGQGRGPLKTPSRETDWLSLPDEEYPWNSWPWGPCNSPESDYYGGVQSLRDWGPPSLVDPGTPEQEDELLPNCSCQQQCGEAKTPDSCSCNTHDGSRRSAASSTRSQGGQGPPGPLRKCKEALIGSADLTGGLLWARRRSHSFWEFRRPFSNGHMLLKFTRSLSLQW